MRMRFALVVPVFVLCCGGSLPAQSGSEAGRTVVRKIIPVYPEFARRMSVAGTVKLYAIVAPDGKVKSVETLGGNPVFLQPAKDAITQWKYAPAPTETKEFVELHFNP